MKTATKTICRFAVSIYVVLSMTVFIAMAHEPIKSETSEAVPAQCIGGGAMKDGQYYPAGS